MILNIVTCLYRSEYLKQLADSIPKEPDINWLVMVSFERMDLLELCLDLKIKAYVVNYPDKDVHEKVNASFKHLEPGYFVGCDDDTTFHPNCYQVFKNNQQFKMIVGHQILKDGTKRPAQKPQACYTDGAQAIIHTDLLKSVHFNNFACNPVADCDFLLDCWNQCQPNEIKLVNEVISNYNFLR